MFRYKQSIFSLSGTINHLYNHVHFGHKFFCVTHFFAVLVTNTKIFRVIITLVSSSKYLQSFLCKCDSNGENLRQIIGVL
jgi:hypothetical protein